jgi:phenylpropionate dioxygenase-like ring-hydroxylating dioxygenase large terminal subunit
MQWNRTGQPLILVHAENGDVNAFYNTCSHRGAPVVVEETGRSRRLTCRYHGWSYDHDGALVAIRNPENFHGLDFSCRGLKKVRCERYGRLVFVNFSMQSPSLMEWLGPIAEEWKEFQFDKCRLSARNVFDLDCNWKIAMEANLEVYHVPTIHPKTIVPVLDARRTVNTLYPNGHGRMVAPIPGAGDARNSEEAQWRSARPEIDTAGEIARTCTQSYNLFPNLVAPLNQYVIPPLLFWPNGIDKCRIETWTIAPDWGKGEGPDMWTEGRGERLGQVLLEDTTMCERVQVSMHSDAFEGVPLSYQEARIYHWHQAADGLIGTDLVPRELRVSPVIGKEWIYPNDPRLACIR